MHVVVHDVEAISRDVHHRVVSENIQRETPGLRDAAICYIRNERVVFSVHRVQLCHVSRSRHVVLLFIDDFEIRRVGVFTMANASRGETV